MTTLPLAIVNKWTRVAVGLLLSTASLVAAADPQLVTAAKNRDTQAVRALLNEHVDSNAPQADGATALHWAAYWGDQETLDLLIRAGANVNAVNDLAVTPLYLACANRHATVVIKLLEAGADANAIDSSGESVLMACARTGSAEAVQALLAHNANVNVKEPRRGQTALMWAVARQHPEVVQALIERGADVHARTQVTTLVVSRGNRYAQQNRTADAILAEVPTGGFTPLLFAAQQGDVEAAGFLLAAGANVNEATPDGTSVLIVAAHSGHGKLAAYLLEQGADPNWTASGYTALHAAVLRGDLELVKRLLAHGADPNAKLMQGTPVRRWSTDYGLPDTFIGATPFWLAARYGEAVIMRALATGGADPTFALKSETPLLVAAGLGLTRGDRRDRRIEGLQLPSPEEDERMTLEAVKAALDLGNDVNAADEKGDTALHVAASKGYKTVIQILADAGARLDAKNKGGQTALAIATRRPRQEDVRSLDLDLIKDSGAADLLRKLGARE